MSSKLWLMTPCLAVAATIFLSVTPGSGQRMAAGPAPCVKIASAETTDVMSDAAPDACVYSVGEMLAASPCRSRAPQIVAVPADRATSRRTFASLEWPGDFVTLTANAASDVFHTTIGLIGDAYDYAERKAELLWI